MELQEMGWRGTDGIAVARNKDSEDGKETSGSINASNIWTG